MIAKELRYAGGIILFLVIAFSGICALSPLPYGEIVRMSGIEAAAESGYLICNNVTFDEEVAQSSPTKVECPPIPEYLSGQIDRQIDPVEYALQDALSLYSFSGGMLFTIGAGMLGVVSISPEVKNNTLYLLLSRPRTRSRILLTKYLTAATALLAIALFGSAVLAASLWIKGYPVARFSASGFILSAGLLWLGSLFALGVGTLISVTVKNILLGIVATGVTLYTLLFLKNWLSILIYELNNTFGMSELPTFRFLPGNLEMSLDLIYYWSSESLFLGESFAFTNFAVCAVAAAVPLLAAVWLFNRKEY